MTGIEWLFGVAYSVPAGVLILAGVRHLVNPQELRSALSRLHLSPAHSILTARGTALVEVLLGITVVTGAWAGAPIAEVASVGIAALYGAFVLYLFWLKEHHPEASCGCGAGKLPVTGWAISRTLALLLLALGAMLQGPELAWLVFRDGNSVTALMAIVAISLLLNDLPDLMFDRSRYAMSEVVEA